MIEFIFSVFLIAMIYLIARTSHYVQDYYKAKAAYYDYKSKDIKKNKLGKDI